MDFKDLNINIQNSMIMFASVILTLFVWQFLSTWAGEMAKRVFKKQQEHPARRKFDDSEWFNKFIEHNDSLTGEIHDFTATLMKVVEVMAETNKALAIHIADVTNRDAIMMDDLKKIKNLTQGRK